MFLITVLEKELAVANTMNWNSVESSENTISRFCLMTLSSLPTGSAGLRGGSSLIISAATAPRMPEARLSQNIITMPYFS